MSKRAELFESAARALLSESGCTVRKWRMGSSGSAWTTADDWGIAVPRPRGPVSFSIFAHEVGHQILHRHNSAPRWVEEVQAWEYALDQFERFDLPGAARAERAAIEGIAYSFAKAIRRSSRLTEKIVETYPDWWQKVVAAETQTLAWALLNPSKSRERQALDA